VVSFRDTEQVLLVKFTRQYGIWLASLALVVGCATSAAPQNTGSQKHSVTVRKVGILPAKDSVSVNILLSAPVNPQLTKLSNPPRIVVDFPNASFQPGEQEFPVRAPGVKEVRVSQFRTSPMVARVVVELSSPQDYSVTSSGNKVVVTLTPEARSADGAASSQASENRQQVTLSQVATALTSPASALQARPQPVRIPSTVSATSETSTLQLPRGGEVRVCPGTTLSLTSSQNGRDLMFGISTGSIETDYNLGSNSDVILTPDFRILMPGPGTFHFAVQADPHGNTCVRSLPGNTASLIVSELMGDATYQVFPDQQVVFRAGRLSNVSSAIPPDCGCPAPPTAMLRAESGSGITAQPDKTESPAPEAQGIRPDSDRERPQSALSHLPSARTHAPETNPPPPNKPPELHVQVDVPFVYRATEATVPANAAIQQLPYSVPSAQLRNAAFVTAHSAIFYQQDKGESNPVRRPKSGLMAKLRGFFGSIFH